MAQVDWAKRITKIVIIVVVILESYNLFIADNAAKSKHIVLSGSDSHSDSTSSNPHIYLSGDGGVEHFEINVAEDTLIWCDDSRSGLGNRIGTYWIDRSVAFWLNLSFYIDPKCACNSRYYRQHHDTLDKHNGEHFCNALNKRDNAYFSWTQLLPNTFSYHLEYLLKNGTIYDDISIDLNDINNKNTYILYSNYIYNHYSLQRNVLPSKTDEFITNQSLYYKPVYTSFGFLNELFIKIIQYETQNAFKLYYQQRTQAANIRILNEYNFIQNLNPTNSIAIHWRCGDILRHETGSYGFDSLSYYQEAIKIWQSRLGNSTPLKVDNVYIITNLDKATARHLDIKYIDDCSKLLSKIRDSIENVFKDYYTKQFVIITNGSINSDQYLLSHSRFSLCGYSTFCFMAQYANTHHPIIQHKYQRPVWWPQHIDTLKSEHKVNAGGKYKIDKIAQEIINN